MRQNRRASGNPADDAAAAAEQFTGQQLVKAIREYGAGNVHDTFLVTLDSQGERHLILQRLNTQVFRQPELVMANMRTVTEHVRQRLNGAPLPGGHRFELPNLVSTRAGNDFWVAPDGSCWRALSFIEAARSFATIQDLGHAQEVGYALGMFQKLISDLPTERLADTLVGFHLTPGYLLHFDAVLGQKTWKASPEVDYGLDLVHRWRDRVQVLERAKAQGRLRLRPIHGDPKVDNVLIDINTRQAVSIIDLDTVKPGLIHYDIGDCLRSSCNSKREDTEDWQAVRFDPDICRAILEGYVSLARAFLSNYDYDYFYDAAWLIAFELGLRFLTDYLEGNVYFKVRYPEHNLIRALVQFRLAESIESQMEAIQAIIRDVR